MDSLSEKDSADQLLSAKWVFHAKRCNGTSSRAEDRAINLAKAPEPPDDVILSRVCCGEGSMQLAGSTGALREFIGASRQNAGQDDTVETKQNGRKAL
jgi:hypothetical protein